MSAQEQTPNRRVGDTLSAVDHLVDTHLQAAIGGTPLARLAATMAIDYSGATWGSLFLDEGRGLEPVLKLGRDLRPASPEKNPDPDLLDRAVASMDLEAADDRLAAPVLLEGRVRGLLYLEGVSRQARPAALRLATGVAQRIATLLHSANLFDRVTRQQHGLQILEELGEALAGSELADEQLDLAIESACRATASDSGVILTLAEPGCVAAIRTFGSGERQLKRSAERLGRELERGQLDPPTGFPAKENLLEELWASPITPHPEQRQALGFLAIGRVEARPYEPGDRLFLRALARLIEAALARQEYFRQASVDHLTSTGTRMALQLNLLATERRASRTGRPFSIVLADIDHFKEINDRYGHAVGDEVLREVAAALRRRLRSHDFVARYGGDEFVIVLPETPASEARRLAGELQALVRSRRFSEHHLEVTLSLGVSTSTGEIADIDALLQRADRALYDSKGGGRDRVSVFAREENETHA